MNFPIEEFMDEEKSGIVVEVPPDESPTPIFIPVGNDYYEFHMDNSAKELFESCARAAEYYTVDRREANSQRASLFRGSVVHHALAIRRTAHLKDIPQRMWENEQLNYISEAYADKDFGPDEWRTCEHAINTILEYNRTWPIEAEPFSVVPGSIEQPFSLFLGEAEIGQEITTHQGTFFCKEVKIFWDGILDCRIDYGVPYVMDSKTTSILGPQFWDNFQLDSQMMGYTWATRKLGYPTDGVFVDAIAGRKITKTGVPYECQRQRIPYEQAQLDEWERDTFTHVTDFLEHLCRDYFPKSPKWCFGKYGRCQYWDICIQRPDQRESTLQGNMYKPVTWNPLKPQTR